MRNARSYSHLNIPIRNYLSPGTCCLKSKGYLVSTITDLADSDSEISLKQFDLLIHCPSLLAEDCDSTLGLTHSRSPLIKSLILIAAASGCSTAQPVDQVLDTMEGPEQLLSTVDHLAVGNRPAHIYVN